MKLAEMVAIQTANKTYKRCGLGVEVNDGNEINVVLDKESETE